jgi:hypothetical protein
MRSTVFWRIAALAASTMLVLVLAGTALGVIPSGTTKIVGAGITSVQVVRGSSAILTTDSQSPDYTTIPGASVSISVPDNEAAIVLIRFSGESSCSGPAAVMCDIRVIVGGKEAFPKGDLVGGTEPPLGSAFDSNDGGNETEASSESHSMDRSFYVLAGTYTVKAQWRVSGDSGVFWLDDWSMTVEMAPAKV